MGRRYQKNIDSLNNYLKNGKKDSDFEESMNFLHNPADNLHFFKDACKKNFFKHVKGKTVARRENYGKILHLFKECDTILKSHNFTIENNIDPHLSYLMAVRYGYLDIAKFWISTGIDPKVCTDGDYRQKRNKAQSFIASQFNMNADDNNDYPGYYVLSEYCFIHDDQFDLREYIFDLGSTVFQMALMSRSEEMVNYIYDNFFDRRDLNFLRIDSIVSDDDRAYTFYDLAYFHKISGLRNEVIYKILTKFPDSAYRIAVDEEDIMSIAYIYHASYVCEFKEPDEDLLRELKSGDRRFLKNPERYIEDELELGLFKHFYKSEQNNLELVLWLVFWCNTALYNKFENIELSESQKNFLEKVMKFFGPDKPKTIEFLRSLI